MKRPRCLHRLVIRQLCDRIEAALKKLHLQYPLRAMLDRARLISRLRYLNDDGLIDAVLERMHSEGRLKLSDKGVALAGHGPKLSQNEQKLLDQLVEQYRQAGLQPPTVKQCQGQSTRNPDAVAQLIALAADEGRLVEISSEFYLHADVERDMRRALREKLLGSDGMTLSQIREIPDTTRKYAVPYCEHLDRTGFTKRQGDLRVLGDRV